MGKSKDRYLTIAAVIVQASAAIGFMFVGETEGATLIVAIPLAAVSLMLAGHGARESSRKEESPPEPAAPRPRLEEMILTLQEDVSRLREDREFYRELYVDGSTQADPRESAAVRSGELTYRLVPERTGAPRPPTQGPR